MKQVTAAKELTVEYFLESFERQSAEVKSQIAEQRLALALLPPQSFNGLRRATALMLTDLEREAANIEQALDILGRRAPGCIAEALEIFTLPA